MVKKYPELFILAMDGMLGSYINDNIKSLPHFARAINEGCFFSDCRPAFLTITPTCWAALQNGFRDTDTGQCGLAFAVPNAQAGFIGLGGERCGDVIYGIAGSNIGGYFGGVHACQIPTAKTETGDMRSLCVISGPRFKCNETIRVPIYIWDIIPTVFNALGYPRPADATGAIVFQSLKNL